MDDETVIRMVSKGLGITMMTEIMMRGRTHGVKTLPVSPKTGRELGIGMHLSKNTPEEILRLRECVLDFKGKRPALSILGMVLSFDFCRSRAITLLQMRIAARGAEVQHRCQH